MTVLNVIRKKLEDSLLVPVEDPVIDAKIEGGHLFVTRDGTTWVDLGSVGGETAQFRQTDCVLEYSTDGETWTALYQPCAPPLIQFRVNVQGEPEYKYTGDESRGWQPIPDEVLRPNPAALVPDPPVVTETCAWIKPVVEDMLDNYLIPTITEVTHEIVDNGLSWYELTTKLWDESVHRGLAASPSLITAAGWIKQAAESLLFSVPASITLLVSWLQSSNAAGWLAAKTQAEDSDERDALVCFLRNIVAENDGALDGLSWMAFLSMNGAKGVSGELSGAIVALGAAMYPLLMARQTAAILQDGSADCTECDRCSSSIVADHCKNWSFLTSPDGWSASTVDGVVVGEHIVGVGWQSKMNTGAIFVRKEQLRFGVAVPYSLGRSVVRVEVRGSLVLGQIIEGGAAIFTLRGTPDNYIFINSPSAFSGAKIAVPPANSNTFRQYLTIDGVSSYRNKLGAPIPSPSGKTIITGVTIWWNGPDIV